jgi:hypothetical protein
MDEIIRVSDLMVPLDEYATVSDDATLYWRRLRRNLIASGTIIFIGPYWYMIKIKKSPVKSVN